MLIPRHSEFRGRASSEARNGTEFREKMKFNGTGWWKPILTVSTRTFNLSSVGDCRCRVLFWVVFSSAEWFGTEFPVLFSSAERFGREFREFASISVPWNGIPSCFSSAEGFGREFRDFASISVPRNGIPRCFLFRGRVRKRNSERFCSPEQPEFRQK